MGPLVIERRALRRELGFAAVAPVLALLVLAGRLLTVAAGYMLGTVLLGA